MNRFFGAIAILEAILCARAEESSGANSAHFSIQHRVLDAGGCKSSSARFEIVSSLNSFGTISTVPSTVRIQPGFPGQLNDAPRAASDSIAAAQGSSLKILPTVLLANDTDL